MKELDFKTETRLFKEDSWTPMLGFRTNWHLLKLYPEFHMHFFPLGVGCVHRKNHQISERKIKNRGQELQSHSEVLSREGRAQMGI